MARNQYLDLLRGVAILMVLGRHLQTCPVELNPWLYEFSRFWQKVGWAGVDLFFVLSGFLVSGLIFKEEKLFAKVRFGRFLLRRGLRIYPSFLVVVGVTVATMLIYSGRFSWPKLLADLTFTQNFFGGLWLQNWSLAVEEHFYFLLALVCFLMQRDRRSFDLIPSLFAFFAIGCLALRLHTNLNYPYLMNRHFCASYLRMDSLMFGVYLSWLWHYQDLRFRLNQGHRRTALTLLAILLLLPVGFLEAEEFSILTWGFTSVYLGFGFILVCFLEPIKNVGPLRLVALIGTWSYSIYLWHLLVQNWTVPFVLRILGMTGNWYAYALSSERFFGLRLSASPLH